MIQIKNSQQIAAMRDAGRITGEALLVARDAICPGMSTKELDDIIRKYIEKCGAKPSFLGYGGFPGSACISIGPQVIHGIPSKNIILKEGDILSIDRGNLDNNGYNGDACRTFPVGNISDEAQKLIRCTEECFYAAYKVCLPGHHLYEISMALQKTADKYGYSLCKEYGGHGIGRSMHEDPFIPNYYDSSLGLGPFLRPGRCIAIEPRVRSGASDIITLDDSWGVVSKDGKLTCHYENDVIITENGPIITSVDENVRQHLKELGTIA